MMGYVFDKEGKTSGTSLISQWITLDYFHNLESALHAKELAGLKELDLTKQITWVEIKDSTDTNDSYENNFVAWLYSSLIKK